VNRPAAAPFADYATRLGTVLREYDWSSVARLAALLAGCWRDDRQLFLCGNGGSAGNAIHVANDFLYGVSKQLGRGLRVTALPANASVLTCLGNDCGYDSIFAMQLAVLGRPGDVLLALSGSGNSPNIVRAVEQAKATGMHTAAILGYGGGATKALVDLPVHFAVEDMQIAEDLQLVVCHMVMQWLYRNPPAKTAQ
jgi:D-sedoheptulose 7-phosphate isomerase